MDLCSLPKPTAVQADRTGRLTRVDLKQRPASTTIERSTQGVAIAPMWVKICGIRDVETALAVAASRPDAIGLNFYEKSPRTLSPAVAAEIVGRLPAGIEPVGLFVNEPADRIVALSRECGAKTVQLHGDEPPEILGALGTLKVIRAFRVGDAGLDEVAAWLDRARQLGTLPWALLIDARIEGKYGGTGATAPWEIVRRDYDFARWPPLILAGGLRPDNVAAAIRAVGPWGVDVAGGVESAVACKDLAMVRQFVEAARAAS